MLLPKYADMVTLVIRISKVTGRQWIRDSFEIKKSSHKWKEAGTFVPARMKKKNI